MKESRKHINCKKSYFDFYVLFILWQEVTLTVPISGFLKYIMTTFGLLVFSS
jgi:hypothetical protein